MKNYLYQCFCIALVGLVLPAYSFANTAKAFPSSLFASVKGVAEDDVLNIRSRPDHRSKKVGALYALDHVGIKECRQLGRATWCSVHTLTGSGVDLSGWVNAHYLSFHQRGYVTIAGRENACYYAIRCDQAQCHVVMKTDFDDKKDRLSKLHIAALARHKLIATDHFGAMGTGDGYCITGRLIEDYLKHNPQLMTKVGQ